MISQQTVWSDIWPVAERLIAATVAADEQALSALLYPDGEAAAQLDLFGAPVFHITLKTVLGRERLGLTRAIETEQGRFVHLEFAWPDPEAEDNQYTAADVVSVRLTPAADGWQVVDVNPAPVDQPLTGVGARQALASHPPPPTDELAAAEPQLLPLALHAGTLRLPLRATAMADEVETLLLPGLQQRAFGVTALVRGRRLWRDFRAAADPDLARPKAWAAAAEYVMGEQNGRQQTQAAVAGHYGSGLAGTAPRIRQIRKGLQIQALDERYTDLQPLQLVFKT